MYLLRSGLETMTFIASRGEWPDISDAGVPDATTAIGRTLELFRQHRTAEMEELSAVQKAVADGTPAKLAPLKPGESDKRQHAWREHERVVTLSRSRLERDRRSHLFEDAA